VRRRLSVVDPRLAVAAGPLQLLAPLGLAAGFDKGEGLANALFALGFGAVEVGTITPRGQAGNPRPRLFRLPTHRALVNRMGFNNDGAAAARERYRRPGGGRRGRLLGINLGKNKDTPAERAVDDYLAVYEALADLADYVVVNVSSPNTPGLRDLQAPRALAAILEPLCARGAGSGPALLLKLAPDLADEAIDELGDLARDLGLAGLVLANTTIGRRAVQTDPRAGEAGGLSGAPLLDRTVWLVSRAYRRHGDQLPVVGVGGIGSADDAWRVLAAGAAWVQAYSGFVYGGPTFARDVHRGLLARLEGEGVANLAALRGRDAEAARPVPPMP
jgi:dihydroorotate dehydrogenase